MRKRAVTGLGRLLGVATATVALLTLGGAPANAAPPTNDTIADAKRVTLPFTEHLDTREATSGPEDAAANAGCGAPATNGSVWYAIDTPPAPAFHVDTAESEIGTTVTVAKGSPGKLIPVTCAGPSVAVNVVPGEQYYVMVSSPDPEVSGGRLFVSLFTFPEPVPEVSLTVDRVGTLDPDTGIATVSGRYTCTGRGDDATVAVRLAQRRAGGEALAEGSRLGLPCDGTHDWSLRAEPRIGSAALTPGQVSAVGTVVGFGDYSTSQDRYRVIELRAG